MIEGEIELAQAGSDAGPAATPSGRAANQPPEASNVCVVTAQGAALSLDVTAGDRDPDGDTLTLISTSQPASGAVAIGADGSLTFTADEPGLQRFSYQVSDGQGGVDDGEVMVLVNPTSGSLATPVLEGLDDAALSGIARACTGGVALDVLTLGGAEVRVPAPEPGQRIQVASEPGQRIELQDAAFAGATYIVVEGGLLVVTDDGRVVYLSDLVDAAQSDAPPVIAVAGAAPVLTDALLDHLQPIGGVASDEGQPFGVVALGPEHGGGAGFTPYGIDSIGTGPDALGPQPPTALGPGEEFLLRDPVLPPAGQVAQEGGGGNGGGNGGGDGNGNGNGETHPPTITLTGSIDVPVGEITSSSPITAARPFPELTEGEALDTELFTGVDQANLTLGPGADASITFIDEIAADQNVLGVYLIAPDGTIMEPKIVFVRIEHADPILDPDGSVRFPIARPGGGPLEAGDSVALSELYDAADLQDGTQFGLFWIDDGWTLNGDLSEGELAFQNADGAPATIFDETPTLVSTTEDGTSVVRGSIYHSADPTPGDPTGNPLNPGGAEQVISGLTPDPGGVTITLEDKRLGNGDDDGNDVTIRVDLATYDTNEFRPQLVARDATLSDEDSAVLSGARVELTTAISPDDALALTTSLDGTGVQLGADSNSGLLVLEGDASIATYQEIIRGIILEPGAVEGTRIVSVQVTDQDQNVSAPAEVRVNISSEFSIIGTDGDDVLTGTDGNDAMSGRGGDDLLSGGAGDDLLDGGLGDDQLDGGAGDDRLHLGPGDDVLTGGDGADGFFVLTLYDRGGEITDFDAGEGDVLNLAALFDGAADPDNAADFVRFEDTGDGSLRVDVDLDGAGDSSSFVPLVTLSDPTGLTTVQEAVDNGTVVV